MKIYFINSQNFNRKAWKYNNFGWIDSWHFNWLARMLGVKS